MAQCELPATFANFSVVNENDLKISFATDKTSYVLGETVQFYFIVENVGVSTFSINWGMDPQDCIIVLPLSCTSLTQDCYDDSPFHHPGFVYFYSSGTTLEPGECRIWARSWDTAERPATLATYNVLGGMFEPTFDGTIGTFHVPTVPILLNITIDDAVPAEGSTWGSIKELFR
jgi:hypothetical protein